MEVDRVDGVCCRAAAIRCRWCRHVGYRGPRPSQSDASLEVGDHLWFRLIGELAAADERTTRHQCVTDAVERRRQRERTWLSSIELERREELDVVDLDHVPAREWETCDFRKRLDSHHSREHRRALDLVVMEERLRGGIEGRLHDQAVVHTELDDPADHRSRQRRLETRRIDAAKVRPLVEQHAKAAGDDDLAAGGTRSQLTANRRHSHLGWQHLDARQLHHLGNRASGGHTDTAPCGPVDDDGTSVRVGRAHRRRQLAQEVIG